MNRHRQLLEKLPPKQQMLDLGGARVWQQLSDAKKCACQSAIADLLYQVAKAARYDTQPKVERNIKDE